MRRKVDVIRVLREQYPRLAVEYGVKRIGLFGSFVQGQPHEESDVDLIVEFEQPLGFRFVEFVEHLAHLLGRKVDVLTPAGLASIRVAETAQRIQESIAEVILKESLQ